MGGGTSDRSEPPMAASPDRRDDAGMASEQAPLEGDAAATGGYRIERDTMGEVRVPADALWGAQTQRAVENFPISGVRMDPAVVRALARVKVAAARVNAELGVIDGDVAEAIAGAAGEVAGGAHADQ